MTILVAGATGLAGSAVVRELTRIGKTVVGISSRDLNLLDRKATFAFLNEIKPTTVIDAAAKVGGIEQTTHIQSSSYLRIFRSKPTLWMPLTMLK